MNDQIIYYNTISLKIVTLLLITAYITRGIGKIVFMFLHSKQLFMISKNQALRLYVFPSKFNQLPERRDGACWRTSSSASLSDWNLLKPSCFRKYGNQCSRNHDDKKELEWWTRFDYQGHKIRWELLRQLQSLKTVSTVLPVLIIFCIKSVDHVNRTHSHGK